MKNCNCVLNKFFAILVSIVIVAMPVSYAQQTSGANNEDGKSPISTGNENSSFLAANTESADGVTPQADANTCSDSYGLNLGTNYNAYIDYAGDVDWFKWNLPSSGKFTANLDVPSNRDYELEVYSSCSNKVCSSTSGRGIDEQCITNNAGSGWIYAKIYGFNNDYSSADKYYIKGSFVATKQYDLAPTGFAVTPSSPTSKDSISVLYEIKNNGPDDVTSYFNYKFYIGGQLYQQCNANSGLKAGWYGSCTRNDISLSVGTHVLKIVADADNNIAETNENNNVKTQDLPVKAPYDLVPGDFTITPSSPTDTDSITVRYSNKNLGPYDVTSYYNSKLYIDDQLYQTCNANNGLKVNEIGYCDRSNIKLSGGTHILKNVVDADKNIAEADENNNVKTQDLPVSHVLQADLTVTDIYTEPSSLDDQTIFNLKFDSKNTGPDNIVTPFKGKLFVDGNRVADCTYDKGAAAGATWTCTLSNQKWSVGTHPVKAIVDSENQVPETNENNNQMEKQFTVASRCVDNDGDGYGSGCSNGNDCNDNNANVNPGKPEICSDNIDNDCDGKIDGADTDCCPSDKPYYWSGSCHTCPQDKPKLCGSTCYGGDECGSNVPVCDKNNNVACCPSDFPSYCSKTDSCWKSSAECQNSQKCGSEGWTVCRDSNYPNWNCRGDGVSRCCPTSYPHLWNSDYLCHTIPEPQKCAVPDGSSSMCACNTNSECAKADQSKPYCSKQYPSPIGDGYGRCMASVPEYCGNGNCAGGENYNTCPTDCGYTAPKGSVTVSVYYSSGANANKPISGAYVLLDSIPQGTTGNDGKLSFVSSYGSRELKVNCPDTTFCDSRTINIKGAEYVDFNCNCNPPGDSDGDGYLDEDEKLLGTDPNDANSNFKTTFGEDSVDLLACLPTPATLLIIWKEANKNGGDLVQANSQILSALNITSVTSTSAIEHPYVVAEAISKVGLDADVVVPTNVSLESAVKSAEYVDGIYTRNELLLIATDKETGTTAIIVLGAGCVGAFGGAVYGIGQGVFDDVKGIVEGIWFVVTHVNEIQKIGSAAKELASGLWELVKNADDTFMSMFRSILGKGKGINLFREGRINNPDAYRHFQVGFVYGFVTGYVTEQVALGTYLFSKVAGAFKFGQLFGNPGKAAKLAEKLTVIRKAEEYGAEVAEKLSKLKYLKEGIDAWTDGTIDALARMMKHNEGWLKGLSEAEAKIAAKNVDTLTAVRKLADSDIENLVKTKLGRQTLVAADASDSLLSKQAKLISKWGTKKADEVVTKCFLFICDAGRISDLKKVLNAMPENFVDSFEADRAVKLLGKKGFSDAIDKVYNTFSSSVLSSAVRNIDDFENIGTGAQKVLKHQSLWTQVPPPTISGFPPLSQTLKDLGKLEYVKGVDELARRVAVEGKGFPYEARRAVILKEEIPGVKLTELGKKIQIDFKNVDGVFVKGETLDMDILYEFVFQTKKSRVIEEIKSAKGGIVTADNPLKNQILKMTKAIQDGVADEAKVVTHDRFDEDVYKFIQDNGNKVQLLEGAIY